MPNSRIRILFTLLFAAIAAPCQIVEECRPVAFDSSLVGQAQDTAWVVGAFRIDYLRTIGDYAVFGVVKDSSTSHDNDSLIQSLMLGFKLNDATEDMRYAILLAAAANDRRISFHLTESWARKSNDTAYVDVCEVDNVNIHGSPKRTVP